MYEFAPHEFMLYLSNVALIGINLAVLGYLVWCRIMRPTKYYSQSLQILESEQGEWYVNYVIEKELAALFSHYTKSFSKDKAADGNDSEECESDDYEDDSEDGSDEDEDDSEDDSEEDGEDDSEDDEGDSEDETMVIKTKRGKILIGQDVLERAIARVLTKKARVETADDD